MRQAILLNDNWYFTKNRETVKRIYGNVLTEDLCSMCEAVTLPHTWNAVDGQDGGNDYYRGTCYYLRSLKKPDMDEGMRVYLEFAGAAMTAEAFLNGVKITRHEGGFSAFRADITEQLKEENLLCVAVDNSANDFVYPQKADFTFYGGIYRDVHMILVPERHFALEDRGMPGIRVTPVIEGKNARVTVEVWTQGGDGSVTFTFEEALSGTQIQVAEAPEEAAASMQVPGEMSVLTRGNYGKKVFIIPNVHLWDGVEDPFLYKVTATLEALDQVSVRFGCRSFSFDAEAGFYLNGRPYPLRGVSRHQDRAGVGNALTYAMHEEDMRIVREIGANSLRLAHYQHAQEFYDLCDENGILAWAEIPYITQHMSGAKENAYRQMEELVTQNYNHPCIYCWGLSNEISVSSPVSEELLGEHRRLRDLCRRLDPTRPTAMAHAFMLETDSPLIDTADLAGYNLYFGWYLGELGQNNRFFDEYHAKFPHKLIGLTEYGADANPSLQSPEPDRGDYTEGYQCIYHEHMLKMIEERPFLWCTYVWNLFDFAADGRDEGGKHGVNQKGLVTFDRQLKKDAFYLYKAYWNRKDAFVHICGRRYAERTERETEVKIYSNCDEVELFADGKSLGTRRGRHVFCYRVPLSKGRELVLEALGRREAAECRDAITICGEEQPNSSYQLVGKVDVVNWFDRDSYDPDCLSIKDTMSTIMAYPEGAVLLEKIIAKARKSRGDVAASSAGNANLQRMMSGMVMESVLKQAAGALSDREIGDFNKALQKIRKNP